MERPSGHPAPPGPPASVTGSVARGIPAPESDATRGLLMRYKALPLSVQSASAPARELVARIPGGPPFRRLLVVLLLPVLLLPWASVSAASSIAVNPSETQIGANVKVIGQGFAPRSHGQMLFDGSTANMPTYRVDAAGNLTATFSVPMNAAVGSHTITASSVQGKKVQLAGVVASATLVIDAPTPTPTPTPTPVPTPTPTAPP